MRNNKSRIEKIQVKLYTIKKLIRKKEERKDIKKTKTKKQEKNQNKTIEVEGIKKYGSKYARG
jgi:hypothetical protein